MPTSDDLHQERRKRLEARLDAVEAAKAKEASGDSHRAMAQGYRFLGEVVGGVFMGAALGWLFDRFAGTEPLGLVIDHNHKTGKVRGLLCGSCNTGIGLLKDSPDVLDAAIEYLQHQIDGADAA